MAHNATIASSPDDIATPDASSRRARWWRLMDTDIGVIPLPFYVLLVALLVAFAATNGFKSEIAMVIGIMTALPPRTSSPSPRPWSPW